MSQEHLLWNSAIDRLFQSGHTGLSGHFFLGTRYFDGLPYLVPVRRASPHIWIMGGTGTGKSARALAPIIAQHIAVGSSVVVLDPKPDKALFETCRVESHHQGVPFRYLCITPGRWSHAFSPFAQSQSAVQTLASRAETIIQALNLDYGIRYGGSYFTTMDELLCVALLTLFPDARSPEAIARLFDSPGAIKKTLGERGWEDSNHIRAIFTKLAAVTPLNVALNSEGVSKAVLDAAIDLRQVFFTPQVVYFALDATQLRSSTRAALGLGFYNLLAASKHVGPKPKVPVVCVLDEAQEIVGPNLSILLEQSRSMGIELILAHQNLEQLRRHDTDYQGTFEENTGLQIVFNPVAKLTRQWMEETSGQQLLTMLSWQQPYVGGLNPMASEEFRPDKTLRLGPFDIPRLTVTEKLGPIWDQNTLMRLSAEPGVAWVRLVRDEGYARDGGQWVPVRLLFHIDRDEFDNRIESPWPGRNGQTVYVEKETAFDRRFTDPPVPSAKKSRLRDNLKRFREES